MLQLDPKGKSNHAGIILLNKNQSPELPDDLISDTLITSAPLRTSMYLITFCEDIPETSWPSQWITDCIPADWSILRQPRQHLGQNFLLRSDGLMGLSQGQIEEAGSLSGLGGCRSTEAEDLLLNSKLHPLAACQASSKTASAVPHMK